MLEVLVLGSRQLASFAGWFDPSRHRRFGGATLPIPE